MSILRSIAGFFYDMLFGCRHDRQTRPFTLEEQTYKVCLECGRHIFYSAVTFEPLTAREIRRMHAASQSRVELLPASTYGLSILHPNDEKSKAAA